MCPLTFVSHLCTLGSVEGKRKKMRGGDAPLKYRACMGGVLFIVRFAIVGFALLWCCVLLSNLACHFRSTLTPALLEKVIICICFDQSCFHFFDSKNKYIRLLEF